LIIKNDLRKHIPNCSSYTHNRYIYYEDGKYCIISDAGKTRFDRVDTTNYIDSVNMLIPQISEITSIPGMGVFLKNNLIHGKTFMTEEEHVELQTQVGNYIENKRAKRIL
jgi:hypothetical protein